jgi:hypothetical protein
MQKRYNKSCGLTLLEKYRLTHQKMKVRLKYDEILFLVLRTQENLSVSTETWCPFERH